VINELNARGQGPNIHEAIKITKSKFDSEKCQINNQIESIKRKMQENIQA
jgi:hypothetical protein